MELDKRYLTKRSTFNWVSTCSTKRLGKYDDKTMGSTKVRNFLTNLMSTNFSRMIKQSGVSHINESGYTVGRTGNDAE
jgi:hypothetical protein